MSVEKFLKLYLYSEPVELGVWSARAYETVEKDWNYYSKSWHRNHGPKVTVTGRFVEFTSKGGKKKVVQLDSWRGNWQCKALIEAGIVKPKKGMMHVRLNEVFDIKLIGKRHGYLVYQRSLKGELVDYCLVSPLGMTYHAATVKECLAGLKLKRQQRERRKVATINWNFLKSLGFCSPGIKEFCSIFDFDLDGSYTPDEVYQAVSANPSAAAPFEKELRQLADAVGFNVPSTI